MSAARMLEELEAEFMARAKHHYKAQREYILSGHTNEADIELAIARSMEFAAQRVRARAKVPVAADAHQETV